MAAVVLVELVENKGSMMNTNIYIAITTIAIVAAGLIAVPVVNEAEALQGDQVSKKIQDKANKIVEKLKKKFGLGGDGGGSCPTCPPQD